MLGAASEEEPQWWWADRVTPNTKHGPVTRGELERLKVAGTIKGNTLIWHPSMSAWSKLSQLPPMPAPRAKVTRGPLQDARESTREAEKQKEGVDAETPKKRAGMLLGCLNRGPKEVQVAPDTSPDASKGSPDPSALKYMNNLEAVTRGEKLVEQLARGARRDLKLEMTLSEAAIFAQRRWRGFIARRSHLNMSNQVHLGYELRVLEIRAKRKNLVAGFLQHMMYMTLLVIVFMLQHGRTVPTRYALVETLKSYVQDLSSPSGMNFDSISQVLSMYP